MARIPTIDPANAPAAVKPQLDGIQQKLGMVQNLLRTLAQSPATLDTYLQISGALSKGALSTRERELIALRVSELNACGYCLAAHAAIAGSAGVPKETIVDARQGTSTDGREEVLLDLAEAIVEQKGHVPDQQLEEAARWGIGPNEVLEIVAHVAFNILTNFANHVAETDLDFPAAPELTTTAH